MGATRKTYRFHDDVTWITITEEWEVDGVPAVAKDDVALPQGYDPQLEVAACLVVSRDIDYLGGRHGDGTQSWAIIKYRNEPPLVLDGAAVLVYDMIATTQRRFADVNDATTGLGVDGEGVEVYVPNMEITYRHRASAFPEAVVGALTGTVNNALWKGRAAGTVLFIGARGENNVPGEWLNEYHFIYHPDGMANVSWQPHKDVPGTDGSGYTYLDRTWGDVQSGAAYLAGNFALLPI